MISSTTGFTLTAGNTETKAITEELKKIKLGLDEANWQRHFPKLNEMLSHMNQHLRVINYKQ